MKRAFLIPILVVALGVGARAQTQTAPPTFGTGTQAVLLDIVAKDGDGRSVPDLRADEVQLFEDGSRCAIESFRLVRSAAPVLPAAKTAPPPATAAALSAAAPSQANLVVLLFDKLPSTLAPAARQGALELLKQRFPPNTWFAVFKSDRDGTRALQPFTADPSGLAAAVKAATLGDDARDHSMPARPVEAPQTRDAEVRVGPSAHLTLLALTGKDLAAVIGQRAALELDELSQRLQTYDSLYALLAISRSLAPVRGRKSVIYFAEAREVPDLRNATYDTMVSVANRANVTIHTVDARGLTAARVGGHTGLDAAVGLYTASGATQGGRGSFNPVASAKTEAGESDRLQGNTMLPRKVMRRGDFLDHVASDTGGLAIAHTNDLGAGLAGVVEELGQYYEVVYTPPNPVQDGRFRRIQVKLSRPGVRLRTRSGYYATPASTPSLAAFELPLIAALEQPEPPRAFEHEAALLQFAPRGAERETVFLARVPASAVAISREPAGRSYRAHLTLLATVEDAAGRGVARLSQDWPVEGGLDASGRPREESFVFRRVLPLPPGRYTLQVALQDRQTGGISTSRTAVELEAPAGGLAGADTATSRASFEIGAPAAAASGAVTPAALTPAVARAVPYDPELLQLLQRASGYVTEYERGFSNLVVEETYAQDLEVTVARLENSGPVLFGEAARDTEARPSPSGQVRPDRVHRKRRTRADLVFVRLAGDFPWASYRDVFEVDGKPVRQREERLVELFSKPNADVHEQANRLLAASAGYNIGPVQRTVNLPTLPLAFLLPENQPRFEFRLGERRTIASTDAVELLFKETSRPTLVRGPRGGDLEVKGRFWVNPTRGTVVRSEVEFDFGPEATARVTADYRPEPTLAIWVPAEMRERYADAPRAKLRTFPSPFEGMASYGKFRRFTVSSEESAVAPAP